MAATTIRVTGLGEEWQRDEYQRYGVVLVQIDGTEYEVGSVIGVPDSQIGTAEAARTTRGLVTAWYADASDWEQVGGDLEDEVMGAIMAAAPRLWAELDG